MSKTHKKYTALDVAFLGVASMSCSAAVLNGMVGWSANTELPSNKLYDATVLQGLQQLAHSKTVPARVAELAMSCGVFFKSATCSDLSWLCIFAYIFFCLISRARPEKGLAGRCATALAPAAVATCLFRFLHPTIAVSPALYQEELHNIQWFNSLINSFFIPPSMRTAIRDAVPSHPYAAHLIETYVRTLVAGSLLYWASSIGWTLYIHYYVDSTYFSRRKQSIMDQIKLSQLGMFVYATLPVISEGLVESGLTQCYFSVSHVGGWPILVLYQVLYLALVEVGVYWMHRTLHTNKFLFRHVHAIHHKYNQPNDLSPWASVAFHPLDGMAQASPYVILLFVMPCNYVVHLLHVFFTAVWATNIHDVVHADSEPIMGAKYHTVHHTHFRYNHGQFFIFCDWYWGTLCLQESTTAKMVSKKAN